MADPSAADRLRHATVLVELGELYDAEAVVAEILDAPGEDLTALDLYAKIKHMRGQLSQAVACWAQIHARSPQKGSALLHLSSMLQLARDPERGAGEFLALGRFQLWRKPASHLELEEVFRLFLARRPDEARAKCDRLIARYLGKDPELYKLAVLAKAWIAELSGEAAEACRLLEELGNDRAFATDTDRILSLARVYEQLGGTEALSKAVHICEFLTRGTDRVSLLGRLASLHRALSNVDEAASYERRFLRAFRRRMHRASLEDLVAVAARHYLPLGKLHTVPAYIDGVPEVDAEAPARRAHAIRAILTGNAAAAAGLLSGRDEQKDEPLDLKYRADLAALEGRLDDAISLYIESLGADPGDVRVLGFLLERQAAAPSERIENFFRTPGVSEVSLRSIEGALRAAPLRPSVWRHASVLHGLRGNAPEAARCQARAADLEAAAGRRNQAVGRALAAAVYHFLGKAKGLIHEVWAERRPTAPGRGGHLEEVLGNLTPELVQSVRNTFVSVREYAQARLPHLARDVFDYTYAYKVTKEDEPSGGLSAGLPTALAFLSVFLNRPVPQDVASSGVVVADAHDVLVVRSIGEPEYKVRGAYNRNLRMLILPLENKRELDATPLVPPAIVREIVRYTSDFDQAVGLVFGDDVWT